MVIDDHAVSETVRPGEKGRQRVVSDGARDCAVLLGIP